ncbi:carbohydrate ABC transporter permease [Paenibacillus woosongensis]|uniref:ABC transporter permease subunit n=1 Tax=Paenibacillus woosongensis TaxID=307580 RepID=A0A7X3CQP0_9BACL|nr:carbohydrate ABC transporter permease [Paenibacillus woosongensis]MUG48119.1 ABC transporter permease subunit [Paenibacillus woosongensis]GIP58264.1 sugar ABC transporter permease [Paenibacillus woosongensis]
MVRDHSWPNRLFNMFNVFIMACLIVLTLYPFWYSVIGSFNDGLDYAKGGVYLWTRQFTWDNYSALFSDTALVKSFVVTLSRTVIGTVTHVLFTALFAYAFSRRNLRFKRLYSTLGLMSMYLSGGLIPYFILINALGLYNNFLVFIIPTLFSFWNVILFRSYFAELPEALIESAKIDGAGEYTIFFRIILSLSKPVIAAISLFTAVGHWNAYYDAMIFTQGDSLQTVQLYILKLIQSTEAALLLANMSGSLGAAQGSVTTTTLQLAAMVAASLPIVLVYPFVQKFFIKGMLIGSVKG